MGPWVAGFARYKYAFRPAYFTLSMEFFMTVSWIRRHTNALLEIFLNNLNTTGI